MTLVGSLVLMGLFLVGSLAIYVALALLRGRVAWASPATVAALLVVPWILMLRQQPPFGEFDVGDTYLISLVVLWSLPVVGAAVAQAIRPHLREPRRSYWMVLVSLPVMAYALSYVLN